MKQVASLRYGVIFKKAFCDPLVFKAFAKDMLNIDLEIDIVETEKSFSPSIGQVDSRFDLFAQDVKNRLVVDIQHARYEDHFDRFLHYHCAAILEQVKKAKDYHPIMKVYTIVVLTSRDKHEQAVLITDFRPKDLKGKAVSEIEHKILYLCPKHVSDETPEPYREWLKAIEDTLDGQVDESQYHLDIIQRIFEHIEEDGVSPKERARMFDEYGEEQLKRKMFAEAKDEGKAEGLAEGEAKGEAKGKAEGKAEGIIQIARQLLDILDEETISQKTGLPLETIRSLKN